MKAPRRIGTHCTGANDSSGVLIKEGEGEERGRSEASAAKVRNDAVAAALARDTFRHCPAIDVTFASLFLLDWRPARSHIVNSLVSLRLARRRSALLIVLSASYRAGSGIAAPGGFYIFHLTRSLAKSNHGRTRAPSSIKQQFLASFN